MCFWRGGPSWIDAVYSKLCRYSRSDIRRYGKDRKIQNAFVFGKDLFTHKWLDDS